MVDFTGLEGNEAVCRAFSDGFPGQTFLIEGDVGSGRHTLMRILTAAALCRSEDRIPCGHCDACRKAAEGVHVDVTTIPPDIRTEDLRRVLETVPFFPNEGKRKVYVLDEADKLGTVQQNVLLKTLEEPPRFAVFLLLCTAKEGLLETIRSRCTVLSLKPLDNDTVRRFLERKFGAGDPGRLAAAVDASDGYLGRAVAEYENERTEFHEKCERVVQALLANDPVCAANLLGEEKDRERHRRMVAGVGERLEKLLIALVTRRAGFPLTDTEHAAVRAGERRLSAYTEIFAQAKRDAERNVNLTLFNTAIARQCAMADEKKQNRRTI